MHARLRGWFYVPLQVGFERVRVSRLSHVGVKELERWPNSWGQLRCSLLRSRPVILTFLRTVDAVEAYAFGVVVVQEFDGVAVEDGDDGTGHFCRECPRYLKCDSCKEKDRMNEALYETSSIYQFTRRWVHLDSFKMRNLCHPFDSWLALAFV